MNEYEKQRAMGLIDGISLIKEDLEQRLTALELKYSENVYIQPAVKIIAKACDDYGLIIETHKAKLNEGS